MWNNCSMDQEIFEGLQPFHSDRYSKKQISYRKLLTKNGKSQNIKYKEVKGQIRTFLSYRIFKFDKYAKRWDDERLSLRPGPQETVRKVGTWYFETWNYRRQNWAEKNLYVL